jgi:hypothetical protein
MNAEAFSECLQNFEALAEKKVSSFVVLEFDNTGYSYEQMDALLAPKVRANDILGLAPDGKVLLLLAGASEKDLPFVLPRFETLGLTINVR